MSILSRLGEPIWSITVPVPTSNNKMYMPVGGSKGRGGSRLIISPEYRLWRESLNLLEWNSPVIDGRVFIGIEVRPGQTMTDKSDSDGFIKASIDCLVRHGVLADDSRKYVVGSLCYFGRPVIECIHDGYAIISVYPESIL